ncbi:nucleophile aminohydrolase [Mycena maculata]|uniref:Nucleophile aminohydrolase n=1 Tax=Mycena maculata TaxID=230809 RepID=A0AAD7KD47_9AGAR|nr:nucleophile aminohydrolase [Mycena maculata]
MCADACICSAKNNPYQRSNRMGSTNCIQIPSHFHLRASATLTPYKAHAHPDDMWSRVMRRNEKRKHFNPLPPWCRWIYSELLSGQQPLSDEDDLIHCVVTGEICDHERVRAELEGQGSVFKTKSDSELISCTSPALSRASGPTSLLSSYKGDSFRLLSSLRGEHQLLFAARDRLGVQPLYYTISDGRLLVASEMKTFISFGWKAQWDIESVVQSGDFSDDRTVFKRVNKLMAGHYLLFRRSGYLKRGYAWPLVDSLRKPDPAGLMATVPVLSLSKNSYNDAQLARRMFGGISSHHAYAAAATAGVEVYNVAALAVTGPPDVPRAIAEGFDPRVREKAISGEWHPLHVASYVFARTILLQDILNHMGERMDMAHSVEGRPPFLDHNVVEYINTLSPSLKVRPIKGENPPWTFMDKWILRQAVQPYVLDELYLKKLGYNAPPGAAIRRILHSHPCRNI